MANTYELIVKTVDQSTRSLRNIERGLAGLERRSRTVNLALKGVGAAVVAVVSARALSNVIQVTSTFEDLQTTLNSVTGSAAAGAQAFNFIQRFATQTQFGIEDLSNAFIKLQAAGITPTERLLTTFTDTAAVTTDQIGTLQAITDLLSRTTGGGLGLEEIERLADRGIPVYRILAEEVGVTRQEISEFGQTAEGARTLVEGLLRGLDREFGGATAARLQNLSTIVSNFQIATRNAIGEFGSGLAPALKEVISGLTDFINANDDVFRALGQGAGEVLLLAARGIGNLADSLGLLNVGGIQIAIGNLLVGLGSFSTGFEQSIASLLQGFAAVGNAIIDISNKTNLFNRGIELDPGQTVDDLRQELLIYRSFLQDSINDLGQFEQTANNILTGFGSTPVIGNLLSGLGVDPSLTLQLQEVDRLLGELAAGNFTQQLDFSIPAASANEFATNVSRIGQELIATGEAAARNAEINAQFPFYPDAIFRAAEAQRALNSATNETTATTNTAAQAFDTLINQVNETIAQQQANQEVIRLVNAAYRDGTINVDQYRAAMANLGTTIATTGSQLSAYQQFLNQTISTATQSAQQIGFASQAQADLRAQLDSGQISIDTYAQAMQNLNGILGITTTTTTGGGGAAQAIETINSTYEKGIESIAQYELNARNVSGAMQLLERDFANGNLSLGQFGIAMEAVGGNMDDIQNRSLALGLSITESFASAGDGLARGLARGITRGESIMSSFKNFMQSILDEILYQIIQQAFIRPLISSMTAGLSSAFGAFASGGAGAFGGGGFGSLIGGSLFGPIGGFLGGILGFANGGVVPGRPTAGDSVPILATPGEVILNKQQQAEVMRGGGGGEPITVNFNISAIDTQTGTEFILKNKKQITGVIQQAYNQRGQNGPLG